MKRNVGNGEEGEEEGCRGKDTSLRRETGKEANTPAGAEDKLNAGVAFAAAEEEGRNEGMDNSFSNSKSIGRGAAAAVEEEAAEAEAEKVGPAESTAI